jgi:hypothetical protein
MALRRLNGLIFMHDTSSDFAILGARIEAETWS